MKLFYKDVKNKRRNLKIKCNQACVRAKKEPAGAARESIERSVLLHLGVPRNLQVQVSDYSQSRIEIQLKGLIKTGQYLSMVLINLCNVCNVVLVIQGLQCI